MNSNQQSKDFRTQLLQQESSLTLQEYQEHRMQLEARLAHAERNQKLAHAVGITSILLAAGLFPIVASGWFGNADPWSKDSNFVSVTLAILYTITCVIAAVSVATYYSRLAPKKRQASEDLRDEMFREMHRELAELREQVSNLHKSRSP
jgi:hypothetical protein